MNEIPQEKHCQWDVIVETCMEQNKIFSVTSTTVRDLKLQCEVEFAIPAELQVLVHEKIDLNDATTISSLPTADRDNIRTLRLHPISGLKSFVSSCMKGDIQSVTKGIQDNTNQFLNKGERAFVAAFIAAGSSGKRELLNSLLGDKKCFVDIVSRRTKLSQRSLLHAAVAGGDLSCVMNIMTLTHGSLNLLHIEDAKHETPLDLARRLKKPALVELMEKHETIPSEEKTASAEISAREKTNLNICLESTSLNEFDLTSENKNAKRKDQVSGWITEASQLEIRGKPAQTSSQDLAKQDPDLIGMEKDSEFSNGKHDKTLDQRTVIECSTFLVNDVGECETKQTENSSNQKTQKEKSNTSQQKTKTRFSKSSLKLRIPLRNKNKSTQEKRQSIENETASGGETRATGVDKQSLKSASSSNGTVPEIKIIKNMESTHVEHVNSYTHTPERLSPTTENLMTTQRPFSAHGQIMGSPTTSRRLIYGRPRSSTMEKDWCSHSPPRASTPSGVYNPHPPDSSSSSRRQSWSPSPDLVSKLSPILQRKFGSACDLERPRSGSLKLNSIPNERRTFSPTTATLPLVECKKFDAIRQDLPVQSLSAPTSPQSPRKLLPLKINQELEELHHRYFSTRARAQSLDHRRGSLPGNLGKDNKDKDENRKEHVDVDTRHKHGIPFEVWLREKEEQTARKREFESAAMKAVEKLADQTWSEILSQGKTHEQWRREKDQTKIHKNRLDECVEHARHGECYKKALKFEEWLKKKDEEELRREEERRQEAERHFEENRRKREVENERKIAKLTKHEK